MEIIQEGVLLKIEEKISNFHHKDFWKNFLFKLRMIPAFENIEDEIEFLNLIFSKTNHLKYDALISCVKTDNLEIATFILNTGFLSLSPIILASETGKIEFLDLFKQNSVFETCITKAMYASALKQNLEVLKWFYENGYTQDEILRKNDQIITQEELFKSVIFATSRNFKIVKWIYSLGFSNSNVICSAAVSSENIEYLSWALENGGIISNDCFEAALKTDNIEILDLLMIYRSHYSDFVESPEIYQINLCNRMARLGNFKSLKWLIKQGFKYDIDSCAEFAVKVLKTNFKNQILDL